MPRWPSTLCGLAAAGLGTVGLAAAAAADAERNPTEADRGVIRIGGTGLVPAEHVVPRGEVPVWANEQDQRAVISFPEETAAAFTCDELRPTLYRDGRGRLVSLAIRSLEFQLPCPLAPGRYDYRVHLIRVPGPPGAPIVPQDQPVNPDRTFEGRLIVR